MSVSGKTSLPTRVPESQANLEIITFTDLAKMILQEKPTIKKQKTEKDIEQELSAAVSRINLQLQGKKMVLSQKIIDVMKNRTLIYRDNNKEIRRDIEGIQLVTYMPTMMNNPNMMDYVTDLSYGKCSIFITDKTIKEINIKDVERITICFQPTLSIESDKKERVNGISKGSYMIYCIEGYLINMDMNNINAMFNENFLGGLIFIGDFNSAGIVPGFRELELPIPVPQQPQR